MFDTLDTYDLDPLLAQHLKLCQSALVPVSTNIVNEFLSDGTVSGQLKELIVRPLIKKPTQDRDIL